MSPALAAASLAPYLRGCGYQGRLLRAHFRFGDGWEAPLVGFAHEPADARSACIAAVNGEGNSKTVVGDLRQLGAPVFLVCEAGQLQWWRQGRVEPSLLETHPASAVPQFFAKHARDLSPEAVYRAKTWGSFRKEYQLSFVDVGLMPLVDHEIGQRLTSLVERVVHSVREELWPKKEIRVEQGAWLLKSVFWLVAAKILHDKGVPAFGSLDLLDVDTVLQAVGKHYGARSGVSVPGAPEREALLGAAQEVVRFAGLGHVTTESLAYVYENALISRETRQQLGTHSTPPYLVDYIVWQLAPWIEALPPDQRDVFEPACGHAAFLVAALRLLKEVLPESLRGSRSRRDYLRKRLHGVDRDAFALELALLSLTLADIPNPNGWDLQPRDMFVPGLLEAGARQAGVFLANPPFERFTPEEKERYSATGIELSCLSKPTEMLIRSLPYLRPEAVFGIVVPQGFLHSKEATPVRRLLAERFEIAEICQFPDKVFSFSDAESSILIGRRSRQRRVQTASTRYCVVRDHHADAFKTRFQVTSERVFRQSRFSGLDEWNMWVPDLEEVWRWCQSAPDLASIADIAKGMSYKGREKLPPGLPTFSPQHFPGAVRGYERWDRKVELTGQPEEVWMNLDPRVIREPGSGTTTGVTQVLLSYARVRRGPWRLMALLDEPGHPVTSRFITVRALLPDCAPEFFWALCNSPLANAFMYTHTMKRDNLVHLVRKIPSPVTSNDDRRPVVEAARTYLNATVRGPMVLSHQRANADLQRLLLQVDAEVLRLYDLPPRLERQLLDTFRGWPRPGVPFPFERYYPDDYEPCFPLHDYLSEEYQRSTAGALRERYKPAESPELREALRKAVELFQE